MWWRRSPWPRSAAYYGQASWRATWPGEGGGVLMNQAPHDLDLVCHLMGRPDAVVAWTRTDLHKVEVEDTSRIRHVCWLGWASLPYSFKLANQDYTPVRVEVIGPGYAKWVYGPADAENVITTIGFETPFPPRTESPPGPRAGAGGARDRGARGAVVAT